MLVRIETAKGDITAEIYVGAAPVTPQNFLDYDIQMGAVEDQKLVERVVIERIRRVGG